MIAAIDGSHIWLAGDAIGNSKFYRKTGNEVWGDRRIRLISQARIERSLIALVHQATFELSTEQLEKCVTAIEQILGETP